MEQMQPKRASKKQRINLSMTLCCLVFVSVTAFANGFGIGDGTVNNTQNSAMNSDIKQLTAANALARNSNNVAVQPALPVNPTASEFQREVDQSAMNNPPPGSSIAEDNSSLAGPAPDQDQSVTDEEPAQLDETASVGEPSVPQNASDASIGDTEASKQAFSNTTRNLMPLSPDQIRALRYLFDQSQRAAATEPASLPPKPTSSAVIVNLSPGSTPPVIRLRAGYVTSLVFLDSTGQPWPIAAYDLGNPKSFNIQWDQKSNTLMVQALDSYQTGNLAVMLKEQDTPVMITLLPGQQQIDYRVDLRVPGFGPNASPILDDVPGVENPKLLDFLNGTPPPGSQRLRVSDPACQAWLSGTHLYLRTRLTVLSPSWLATMSSPDGTHVYQMVKTPLVLVSIHGKIVQLKIEGL